MLLTPEQERRVIKIITLSAPCLVNPPGPLMLGSFLPKNWVKWKRKFLRYLSASVADFLGDGEQTDLLVYLLGEDAEELFLQLENLGIFRDNLSLYEIIDEIEKHYRLMRNTIYARFHFDRRLQRPGESVNDFLRAIFVLAEPCAYGEWEHEHLREKIVDGIQSHSAREKMFRCQRLSLDIAISIAQNDEMRKIRYHG